MVWRVAIMSVGCDAMIRRQCTKSYWGTMHVPMEWLAIDGTYDELINHIMNTTDKQFQLSNILGIEAALHIDIAARIIWFKRIRIEDDPCPEIVQYYPPLASFSEEKWH
ncbi:hypothetical protein PV325_011625 [Microctonus aethiopoides]|nr:hypothetical protein PV325_011625 [Microctonus aethiopoides]